MNRSRHFLEYQFLYLILVFLVGRIIFMCYNHDLAQFGLWDALQALGIGVMSHDFAVCLTLLAFPCLLAALAVFKFPSLPLRKLLTPYYIGTGIAVCILILADIVMYEFWQFKLHSVVLSYASSPEGTTNSVSIGFLLTRILGGVTGMVLTIVPCILLTPKRMPDDMGTRYWMRNLSVMWPLMLVIFCTQTSVGNAYFSEKIFLNHAATNPVLNFVASIPHDASSPDKLYVNEEETSNEAALFDKLYPKETEDITDTLLNTSRPNILFVFMESFGGKFVRELGGEPDVAPNMSRLIPEGIFWTNYYSNSFRTDRGTVSAYSGWLSYPIMGLMKEERLHDRLPSLARSLAKEGYQTAYLYAGAMTNMGKRKYLEDMNFQQLYDETAFTREELSGTWGAHDETAAMKAYQLIAAKDSTQHWFMVWQTLSSHEPWLVPYQRLDDKMLNAFAYTDHSLGVLMDSLKTLPAWDNMLVVVIPDHGYLYEQDFQNPEFFHSPMLWLGGALRHTGKEMPVLMNQSDLAATLLSQMGISHKDFPWSRNVLSRNYTNPFVYCNYPAGMMFKDYTGTTMLDLMAQEPVLEEPKDEGLRAQKAKAILRHSIIE